MNGPGPVTVPIKSWSWSMYGYTLPAPIGTIGVLSGDIYTTSCPTNQFLTGIYGWGGSLLDQV